MLLRRGIAAARTDRQVAAGGHDVFDWKRRAITHSLHGVDINPTAVEICRLRLWLSLVIDYAPQYLSDITPLPNLELGVLAGDSLVDRMGAEPFVFSLPLEHRQRHFDTQASYSRLRDLQETYGNLNAKEKLTGNDVRRLRELADDINEQRLSLARADLTLAIEAAQAKSRKLGLEPRPRPKAIAAAESELARLGAMDAQLRPDAPFMKPFLWPLAFPLMEERGGFDIVVANPPYIRQESLSATDQKAYEAAFPQVFTGTVDILVPFFARGTHLPRPGGRLAFITSNKYMRAAYGEKLRGYLPRALQIEEVIDFGDLPVFDAAAYPAVVVGQKAETPDPERQLAAADLNLPIRQRILEDGRAVNVDGVRNELDGLPELIAANRAPGFTQSLLRPAGWILEDPALIRLFERLMNEGTPLGEYVNGRMYRGVLTGLNEAFVIDEATRERLIREDARSEELIKPWLRGRDIKRWKADWQGLYLIAIQNSGDHDARNPWASAPNEAKAREIFADTYPSLHGHLTQWEVRLRPRADQGRYWWELRACAYYHEFKPLKILWPRNVPPWEARFAIDESGAFINDKAYMIANSDSALVSYLNSPVAFFLLDRLTTKLRGGYLELKMDDVVGRLPVPSALSPVEGTDFELHSWASRILGLSQQEAALVRGWYESIRVLRNGTPEAAPDDD